MAVVAVALGATVAGTAVVGAQSDGPVLSVGDAAIDAGETAEVAVALDTAPNGVSGFAVNVSVADPSVATVTNVSLGESFDSVGESTAIASDGSGAALSAADLGENVQPGASDVTLGTVTVQGEADGETAIEATVNSMDNDNGNDTDPTVESGSVTVGEGQMSTETTEPPTPTSGSGPGFNQVVALFALVSGSLIAKRAA
ncbi:hypothetical protein [Halomicrobium salinisoli]|uniref:hypothetical protein n=1 Tax=Halomicrobium salinisoli TaxID=2878391 RepID=UPI001CEFEFBE|nr:hypothetical protein [Halomicrobium salinisoli]